MSEKLSAKELKQQVSLRDLVSGIIKLEKRGEEYWGLCPFHTESTPSFAIKVKNGEEVYFCQGCSKGGDVIKFVEEHEHLSTKDAFERVRELAGNTEWKETAKKVQASFQSVVEAPKTTYPAAPWVAKENVLLAQPEAVKYLTEVRGISMETAKALHFGYAQSALGHLSEEDAHARDKGWICFPRILGDKIVAIKMRSIVTKAFVQIANMDPKALFNVETINPLSPVFVTEGEFDTAIMEQAGFCAVSIPNANTKLTPEWKVLLKNAPCVYLAGDNDGKVGSVAMSNLQRELGENAYLLLWPDGSKDANDFFRGPCNRDIAEFQRRVNELIEVSRSTPAKGFTSIIQRLRTATGTDGQNDPTRLHFSITGLDKMAYVPLDAGYVVFYSTYSGTGKSVFTTQVMLDEAKRGEIVAVYSPELSGQSYLALVAAQVLERKDLNRSLVITQDDYRATAEKLDVPTLNGNPFQYYVAHDELPAEYPLDGIEAALKIIRPTRFVIDTFPSIVVRHKNESTTDAEGHTAVKLHDLGKKYGCIFILVCQSNKEAEDLKEKRRDSFGILRGSREIWDKAHAIFLLHRKKKENALGQDDLLENATLVKMEKNRTSGPGAQAVFLTYVRSLSKFYLQEQNESAIVGNDSSNQNGEPQPF
jgi:KaiC/GvpD/RAD55 family RecA-like ATPase